MRVSPHTENIIATSGKKSALQLWDLTTEKSVFKAKNVVLQSFTANSICMLNILFNLRLEMTSLICLFQFGIVIWHLFQIQSK